MRQRERVAEAKRRGKRAGVGAASWVFDGNTTTAMADKILRMIQRGDPAIDDYVSEPAWLSGEWAGASVSELLGGLLHEESDSWPDKHEVMEKNAILEDAYETAAHAAFWREVERSAALRLDGAE